MIMKPKGQLRRLFCLGVAAGAVADEQEESVKAATELNRPKQPKLHVKILRSVSSLKRSRSADSYRRSSPSSAKQADDGDGHRRPLSVLTTSTSGSSSSDTSPASTSSSISFRSSASPNSTPVKRKSSPAPAPRPRPANYSTAIMGLCMLLLSLSVMVFGGRLCAILWTSTWLCLVPRRRAIAAAALPHSDARGRCSDECEKKRVVLEGLLERNRRF